MDLRDNYFSIKKENFEKIIESIKNLLNNEDSMSGGYSSGQKWYSWTDSQKILDADNIFDIFKAWRWEIPYFLYGQEGREYGFAYYSTCNG